MDKKQHILYISIILILGLVAFILFKITSFSCEKNPWYFEKIGLETSQNSYKTIAIIDSGFSPSDTFNEYEIVYQYDYLNDDLIAEDENGHGTALASTLIGCKNSFSGIIKSPKLIILKVMDSFGSCNVKLVNKAILKAIELKVDIINMSFGMKKDNEELSESISLAVEKGIIIVSSIGDMQNTNSTFPARNDEVISVECQSKDGSKYIFSNDFSSTVRIPGVDIPVYLLNKITMEYEISSQSGSSLSSIIFSGLLSISNGNIELDYSYLYNQLVSNKFINYKKIYKVN